MALIMCCDILINAFCLIMVDIIKKTFLKEPSGFTMSFLSILNETCSQKKIMGEIS